MDLAARLGLSYPILQAGMGGGLATAELAAAVSRAGGLGTVGVLAPRPFASELGRARELALGRPIGANLLVPFLREGHVGACIDAGVRAVVLFFGFAPAAVARLRAAGIVVLHQIGSAAEAGRALADGADGVIVQGLEAGGHLLGVAPLAEALRRVRDDPRTHGKLVLAAGGIAEAADVRAARAAGADGVVAGSRFLLTDEARAHPAYKRRALGAARTLVTRLFAVGWPARHRVLPNAATDRWCGAGGDPPRALVPLLHASVAARLLPPWAMTPSLLCHQRTWLPLYTPMAPLAGMDPRVVEVAPLYAGECVRRIHRVVPAAEAVAELARGLD